MKLSPLTAEQKAFQEVWEDGCSELLPASQCDRESKVNGQPHCMIFLHSIRSNLDADMEKAESEFNKS